ncbi:MAG TPA: hypothetical protein VFG42_05925 [Baekduia sp.]|uniref:hypothetical protein n=1 Tax=Baekduia sp. TaxID=2600305 RepID=UPI002D78D855|nr:hypothetical protein [Baekduia sp.]HET6506306.1 hypothetical protein [Baekduia sp.]
MSFFKNVLSDLIEKRLWPVAIALVAALVAVPIVLGGSSKDGTGTPVASVTSTPGGSGPSQAEVVSLEEQAAGKVQRKGSLKNPFVQHHQPSTTTTETETTTSPAASTPSSSSDSPSSGGGASSTGGTSDTPAPTTPAPTTTPTDTSKASKETYRVNFTFGQEGSMRTYDNVARLTPLPSSDNPFFVYLGLAEDGKSAVFLIDATAEPSGDGKCTPSRDDCEQVTLKAGDTEFLDMPSGTAGTVEYTLNVKSIKKATTSKAVAAKARARESKAGREVLRQLVSDDPSALDNWNYSRSLGLLVSKDPQATPDVANVPSTIAGSAAGQAVGSTSTVLTVPGS